MTDIPDTDEATRIRAVLREHPLGMSIKEISAAVAMSRNSVAKYLDVLTAAGQLDVRHVGNAKLYTLSLRVPVGDLLNHARELIVLLDNELRIVQASGSFCHFAGLARETILHSRLTSLPVPLLSSAEEQQVASLLGGGPPWKKEIHTIRNGADVYFNSRFIPTVMENGLPGITVLLEDITERTLARKASIERDRLLHTLFQIPTSPRFFIDRNHKVVYWDRALEIITGIKAEDMVGTSSHWRAFYSVPRSCLVDLLMDGDVPTIIHQHKGKRAETPGADGRYECTGHFPEMQTGSRWLHVTASLIRDTCGTVTGAMETIEDVTEQKTREFMVDE